MLGGAGGTGSRRRAALALLALGCALPATASPYDTVPLAVPLPSPEPLDAPRAWVGARVHRDWESFGMTLSDGTRWARSSPADRFAAEVGITFGRRLSASLEVSGVGLGSAIQVDLHESRSVKVATILQAEVGLSGLAGGAALAASAATPLGGARLVPFLRVGAHAGRVALDRGVLRDRGSPYNEADRLELALVGTAGAALSWRSVELAFTGGYAAIAAAGRFDELRQADASRRGGALATASVRWAFPLGPRRY